MTPIHVPSTCVAQNCIGCSITGCIDEKHPSKSEEYNHYNVSFTTPQDLAFRGFQTLNFVHFCDEQKNIRKVKDLEITAAGGPALLVARELPTAELV